MWLQDMRRGKVNSKSHSLSILLYDSNILRSMFHCHNLVHEDHE